MRDQLKQRHFSLDADLKFLHLAGIERAKFDQLVDERLLIGLTQSLLLLLFGKLAVVLALAWCSAGRQAGVTTVTLQRALSQDGLACNRVATALAFAQYFREFFDIVRFLSLPRQHLKEHNVRKQG